MSVRCFVCASEEVVGFFDCRFLCREHLISIALPKKEKMEKEIPKKDKPKRSPWLG